MAVANMEMMVVDSGAADTLVIVGDEARRLLTSVGRPIVVMPKRRGHGLAESVAPHNRTIGLVLPFSPPLTDIDAHAAIVCGTVDLDALAGRDAMTPVPWSLDRHGFLVAPQVELAGAV